MTEAEWLACDDPAAMVAALPAPPNARKLALFAVAACRADADLMVHRLDGLRSSRDHVEWAERVIEEGFGDEFDGPSEGECYLMATTVNRCVALASGTVEGFDEHALDYAQDLIGAYLDRDDPDDACDLLADLLRDIFGNPFRPVTFDPAWRTATAVSLAQAIYADRAFDRLPILADALQDAGCEDAAALAHCRGDGPHVRGCWAVDLVLGKQ